MKFLKKLFSKPASKSALVGVKADQTSSKSIATSKNDECCIASTSHIFWSSPDNDSENLLKQILDESGIEIEHLKSQKFDSDTSTIGGIRDYKLSRLNITNKWTSLLLHLHSFLGNKLASSISKKIQGSVLVFLEYDEDAWGYCLYLDGKMVNNFWSNPEIVEIDSKKCVADVDLLAKNFQVDKKVIQPYLNHLDISNDYDKVFPDDEFVLSDHWVRVDFMKRLGMIYPDEGEWFYIKEKGVNDVRDEEIVDTLSRN